MNKFLFFLKIDSVIFQLPLCQIKINSELPECTVKRQLLFVFSQSSNIIKREWAESKTSITNRLSAPYALREKMLTSCGPKHLNSSQ